MTKQLEIKFEQEIEECPVYGWVRQWNMEIEMIKTEPQLEEYMYMHNIIKEFNSRQSR
jgi:hypothetical protein